MNLAGIAAFYIGINIFLKLGLAFRVIYIRNKTQTGIGDGGNKELMRAIRAHGNASEYMPMAMIGLFALTQFGNPAWIIHILGFVFTLGRFAHAFGISTNSGVSIGRLGGMVLSVSSMAIIAILCILGIFS